MRVFISMILFLFLSSSCGPNYGKIDPNFLFKDKQASPPQDYSDDFKFGDDEPRDSYIPTPTPFPQPIPNPIPTPTPITGTNPFLPPKQPISGAFPNIPELMSSQNTADTLLKLMSVASPTSAYHSNLENALSTVASTDMAHVKMLMDAVYFPYSKYQNITQELKYLNDSGAAGSDLARKLESERAAAASLSSTLANIANAGFQKATDLNLENGIEALKLLFPMGRAQPAFVTMLERAGTLSAAQKERVMMLASEKYTPEVASDLAMHLLNDKSDKSLKALLALSDRLQWLARDFTLIKGSELFSSFTYDEVKEILRHEYSKDGTVALAAYAKSSEKSHSHVLEIANDLSFNGKEHFIKNILPFYQTITTSEVKKLCQLAQSACSSVLLGAPNIWQDLTTDDAITLSSFVEFRDRDQWLITVVPYLKSPSGSQVLAYASASYSKKMELAKLLFAKVVTKSVADIVQVSSMLYYSDKDSWVDFALELIPTLTTKELYSALDAAHSKRVEIAKKYISRVDNLSPAGIAKISNDLFDYSDKDKWLKVAAVKVNKLSAVELKIILQTSYSDGVVIGESLLDKVDDLTGSIVANIASTVFNYSDKDKWLKIALPHLALVTIAEAVAILDSTYTEGAKISVALLAKTGGLTVANAVIMAKHLTYGAKDTFLLAAIDRLTDLTKANLDLIVKAAWASENQVRNKALEKLGEQGL